MEETERVLIQRLAHQNDSEAFSSIMNHYAAMVYGTCRRILGNDTQAEDTTQDTFFHLLKNAHHVTGSLGGWLHRVATRRAVDTVRQTVARQQRENAYALESMHQANQWSEIEPLVDEALDDLPEEMRELLVLHYLEGKTLIQLAAARNLSQPTLSRRLAAALEELRNQLHNRNIALSLTGLGAMLASSTQAAVPSALLSELGKLTMVHAASSALPLTTSTAAFTAWGGMKAVLAITAMSLAALTGWLISPLGTWQSDSTITSSAATIQAGADLPPSTSGEKAMPVSDDRKKSATVTSEFETKTPLPTMLVQNSVAPASTVNTNSGAISLQKSGFQTQIRGGAAFGGGGGGVSAGGSMMGGHGRGNAGMISRQGVGSGSGGGFHSGSGGVIRSNQMPAQPGFNPGMVGSNLRNAGGATNLLNHPFPAQSLINLRNTSPTMAGRSGGGSIIGGGGGGGASIGGGGSLVMQGGAPGKATTFTTNFSYHRTFRYANGRTWESQYFSSSGSSNSSLPTTP